MSNTHERQLEDELTDYSAHRVVAEQLSRRWGAARVFRKTVAVESGLLARKTLTTSDLLMAYQDDIHDHYKLMLSNGVPPGASAGGCADKEPRP